MQDVVMDFVIYLKKETIQLLLVEIVEKRRPPLLLECCFLFLCSIVIVLVSKFIYSGKEINRSKYNLLPKRVFISLRHEEDTEQRQEEMIKFLNLVLINVDYLITDDFHNGSIFIVRISEASTNRKCRMECRLAMELGKEIIILINKNDNEEELFEMLSKQILDDIVEESIFESSSSSSLDFHSNILHMLKKQKILALTIDLVTTMKYINLTHKDYQYFSFNQSFRSTSQCNVVKFLLKSEVDSMVLSPRGSFVFCTCFDGKIRIFDTLSRIYIKTISVKETDILSISISKNNILYVAGRDKKIRRWNSTLQEFETIFESTSAITTSLYVDETTQRIITSSWDRVIRVFHFATNKENGTYTIYCLSKFVGHSASISTFFPFTLSNGKGEFCVSCAKKDPRARIWDLNVEIFENTRINSPVKILDGHINGINTVAISNDQQVIFTGGEDDIIRCWDWENEFCLSELKGHTLGVTCLCLCKDNNAILMSGSDDRTIRIWNWTYAECLCNFENFGEGILSILFVHVNDQIFVSVMDKSISIIEWNKNNYKNSLLLKGTTKQSSW